MLSILYMWGEKKKSLEIRCHSTMNIAHNKKKIVEMVQASLQKDAK
jgi:hypothetical protein